MDLLQPAYLSLSRSGELAQRAREAHEHLTCCDLCPSECKANRLAGKLGTCKTGERARVSSFGPHLGEEDPLSGWRGSGMIFFTRCNLHCVFCQNHDISQTDNGEERTAEELATMMLELQAIGCHNINFVSPSHVVAQILAALVIAAENGLRIPLVYNTGGYDSLVALKLLDGVIDIYMPDMKYSNLQTAFKYSKVRDYPKHNQAAVKEMYRQVGDLVMDENGLAVRGLLVRHLLLPHRLAGTREIVQFLGTEISCETYLNLMDQYRPCYKANQYPSLDGRTTSSDYEEAVQIAHEAGLYRLDEKVPF